MPKSDMPKPDIRSDQAEPKFEAKPEPKVESKAEVKAEPKLDAVSRHDFYENLEEEMASLLGRPPGKP